MRPDPASNPVRSRIISSGSRAGISRLILMLLVVLAGLVAESATASAVTIHVQFGLQSFGCSGFGLCRIWTTLDGTSGFPADAVRHGNKLTISFQEELPERRDVLPIDAPLLLDSATSVALGDRYLQILPGDYRIDYSNNPKGEVTVDVQRTLPINTRWGQSRIGCVGYGICSIVFDPPIPGSDNMVASTANVAGDILTVQFGQKLSEQRDSVTIDEDIVLDEATARALGSHSITIRRGTYAIDYSRNRFGTVRLDVQRIGITIDVEVGRRSRGCTGFGICSITVGTERSTNAVPAIASMVGPNTLRLSFQNGLPAGETTMPIDESIVLSDSVAQQLRLGYMIIIVGGTNPEIKYAADGTPYVDVPVIRMGITIWIKFGRKDQGCTGFGICAWGVETNMARSVMADAKLEGSTLTVAFGSQTPDAGDVLVIDEDIVLDQDEARALGAEALTIRAGSYPVDYSSNPYGTVQLQTLRIGITIKVDVGRKSRDCMGFGICSITVDFNFTARSVPAIAQMIGRNTLRLRFIGALPENGDEMPIDRAIPLDDETARSLGAGQMTILPGSYKVVRNADGSIHVDVDVTPQSITIWVKIGSAYSNCRGFGICAIGVERDLVSDRWAASDAKLQGSSLTLTFAQQTAERGDILTIDAAIKVDDSTAKALGVRELTILPGRYKVDYSSNPNGTVTVNTLRIGITITIENGRRSTGCTGLGICSITIGLDFTARSVPSLGSIENGRLHLVFGRALPESGNEMMIDEDIELSSDVARGLGRRSVVLKKGTYPIQTDSNGQQSVDIDIAAKGIGIHISVGRPDADGNCVRAFAICRIDINLRAAATDQTVQAVAAVENGMLVLDLLGEAPDREAVMVLEENVELDTALLTALGFDSRQARSIRAGAYSVDTSDNTYGTLRLQTETAATSSVLTGSSSSRTSGTSVSPNPTSGAATIRFSLKHAATVTMRVVDAQGRQVARPLANVTMSAGEQSVPFDATSLPAGTYYYSIEGSGVKMAGSVNVVR